MAALPGRDLPIDGVFIDGQRRRVSVDAVTVRTGKGKETTGADSETESRNSSLFWSWLMRDACVAAYNLHKAREKKSKRKLSRQWEREGEEGGRRQRQVPEVLQRHRINGIVHR